MGQTAPLSTVAAGYVVPSTPTPASAKPFSELMNTRTPRSDDGTIVPATLNGAVPAGIRLGVTVAGSEEPRGDGVPDARPVDAAEPATTSPHASVSAPTTATLIG